MNLSIFKQLSFLEALKAFFSELNVPVNYISEEPDSAQNILSSNYKDSKSFSLIKDVYFLGMVDDAAFDGKESVGTASIKTDYDGLLIFGVTLKCQGNRDNPTRGQIAEITRAFNREFLYTPVVVVFKYGGYIAFANTERLKYKQTWREGEKTGKVSLLKDIEIEDTHRGHISILDQLKIPRTGKGAIICFSQLYYFWQSVFSISVLNKVFYQEIIKWFNLAIKEIEIPSEISGSEKHKDFTVRLIARLIFIWFLKELKVVKEEVLIPKFKNGIYNDLIKPSGHGTSYYKFVLQNLFFNALNSEHVERNQNLFDVYSSDFVDKDILKELIFYSPYLNGGLFDIHPNDWCKEGEILNAFTVPDDLFLDEEMGLNSILSRYKFTIAENTPLEEEIAVDPEMLGRIFENLLAEQSEDTKDVARNNAGAFYTPRPVVSYMCRNTLLKHLNIEIKPENGKAIIHRLLETKVLDPACGSGAFPMGMLEEMMQILDVVDPEGNIWISEMLKSKDIEFLSHISDFIADKQVRYVKKLGLLRNCLFGIDILEYAVEITKLRCWLSLIVEQKVDFNKPNFNLKPLPNLEFKFYKKNSLFRFYKGENLNSLLVSVDKDKLLDKLDDLENEYFIAKSSHIGTKEQIKAQIISLLEKVVSAQAAKIQKEYNSAFSKVNLLISSKAPEREIKSARNKSQKLADELGQLAVFKNTIKDYFIERVVFPSIFSSLRINSGFDIVIGNPPYVNTKLINTMGLSVKLEEEYGFCDDLYNHFTIRGIELTKMGGLICFITSDTFLTLQTKKNLRTEFLSIPKITKSGEGLFINEETKVSNCRIIEIINTPKAFAALVDTAIFTLKKEQATEESELVYVDLRKPNARSFEISNEEWSDLKASKENVASWERILSHTFNALGHRPANWIISHSCDGELVYKDELSPLLKFKLSFEPFRKAINYSIFSPTPYNCQILEKIIKPARPIFDAWWRKIETSRTIDQNRNEIQRYTTNLKPNDITIIGLITDGGQGLATGNNGRYVGYKENSKYAIRCRKTRIVKLFEVIQKHPEIVKKWKLLTGICAIEDIEALFLRISEPQIWQLFDEIKERYDLRIFGKGFMYRIIPNEFEFDASKITDKQKQEGIIGTKCWVAYDKGDKEGNRWYSETPYLIDWSDITVEYLKSHSGKSGAGMPVVRNPQFYFRSGFCWSDVLNPNSQYIKCRLKGQSVNDVKSMSLYDEIGIGDDYLVSLINSFLNFKILREFINGTVAIQMNDMRKLPIIIPSKSLLEKFKIKFDQCLLIKKQYFSGDINRPEANKKLKPIEIEIDGMVNQLYGITKDVDEVDEEITEELIEVSEEGDENEE